MSRVLHAFWLKGGGGGADPPIGFAKGGGGHFEINEGHPDF